MINLRYHIVSLIAVFMALGLGIVAGSTVVDQGIVKVLRGQTQVLQDQRDQAAENSNHQKSVAAVWEAVGGPLVSELLLGRLSGVPVVLLAEHGVPEALTTSIDEAITLAGGEASGVLRFSGSLANINEEDRIGLAEAVGSTRTGAQAVLEDAAAALAARMAVPAEVGDELIEDLIRRGFVSLDRTGSGAFPPPASVLVYVTGTAASPSPTHRDFALPFLRATVGKMLVGVAESLAARVSLTEVVRSSAGLEEEVVTVDHVDTLPGRYALVEDLRDLLAGETAGHHGVRRRTDGVGPTR